MRFGLSWMHLVRPECDHDCGNDNRDYHWDSPRSHGNTVTGRRPSINRARFGIRDSRWLPWGACGGVAVKPRSRWSCGMPETALAG